MRRIAEVREATNCEFNRRRGLRISFFQSDDEFAGWDVCDVLIQDTSDSILEHLERNFSPNPLQAYIELWGIFQGLIIQQDSIAEMHKIIVGTMPDLSSAENWKELRSLRHTCAGHPSKRTKGVSGTRRTLFSRSFGSYEKIWFQTYESEKGESILPTVNLRRLILGYDEEASSFLSAVLFVMECRADT